MKMKNLVVGLAAFAFASGANAALIEIYESNSGIGNIATANSIISSSSGPDTVINSDTIWYSDRNLSAWGLGAGSAFPGGHTTTFVVSATGMVDTNLYSDLWFGHDDGIDVNVGGSDLYTYNGNTPFRNSGAMNLGAAAGLMSFDLLFWENGGAANLFVRGLNRNTGAWEIANFADSVKVPEPAPLALLGLGLAALGFSRRKAKS